MSGALCPYFTKYWRGVKPSCSRLNCSISGLIVLSYISSSVSSCTSVVVSSILSCSIASCIVFVCVLKSASSVSFGVLLPVGGVGAVGVTVRAVCLGMPLFGCG